MGVMVTSIIILMDLKEVIHLRAVTSRRLDLNLVSSSWSKIFGRSHSSSSKSRSYSTGSPVSSWKSLEGQSSYVPIESNVPDLYRSGSLTNRMLHGSYFRPHCHSSSIQQSEEEKNEDSSIWSKIKRHSDFLIVVAILAVLSISMIVAAYIAYK